MGEEIEVVDPAGLMLTVRLDVVSPDRVEGIVVGERQHNPEPEARIVIAIAHLPAPALELVFSRCTEAGAAAFHVVQANRSVARGAKPGRWHTICRESAMLAGRLVVPEVAGPSSLADVVALAERPVMLSRTASRHLAEIDLSGDLTLLIGPEGGWTERELALVPTHASLGPRNLRADTAALVGLAVAISKPF